MMSARQQKKEQEDMIEILQHEKDKMARKMKQMQADLRMSAIGARRVTVQPGRKGMTAVTRSTALGFSGTRAKNVGVRRQQANPHPYPTKHEPSNLGVMPSSRAQYLSRDLPVGSANNLKEEPQLANQQYQQQQMAIMQQQRMMQQQQQQDQYPTQDRPRTTTRMQQSLSVSRRGMGWCALMIVLLLQNRSKSWII
jgi:hypothetical protein